MDIADIFLRVVLPLAAIVGLAWLVRKNIPDSPLTRFGCGG